MKVKQKKKLGRPRTSVRKVEFMLDKDADKDLIFLEEKLPNLTRADVMRRALARLRYDYEK